MKKEGKKICELHCGAGIVLRTNERAEKAEAEQCEGTNCTNPQQIPLSVAGYAMVGEYHDASEQSGLLDGTNILFWGSSVNIFTGLPCEVLRK